MSNQFYEIMAGKSDAELLEIVNHLRNDYQLDAVTAAEKEIEKRNLTGEQVEEAQHQIEEKNRLSHEKANMPLDVHWKVLTCVFPGIFNIIIGSTFKADGYNKKFRDLVKWTLLGVVFYIALILLLLLTTYLSM